MIFNNKFKYLEYINKMLSNQSDETKQMRSNLLKMYKQEMVGNEERKNTEVSIKVKIKETAKNTRGEKIS